MRSESPISWGICIHSSWISLDFLGFYIESKHEISFIMYNNIYIEVNETCCVIQVLFMTVFNLTFLFRVESLSLI